MPRFRYGVNFKRRRLNPRNPNPRWSRARRTINRRGMSARRTRGPSGRGVTSEHPRQFIYAYKRMPKGKRRAWAKFNKKVNRVSEYGLGSRTCVFNDAIKTTLTTADKQLLVGVALYSNKSTTNHMDDLQRISALENVAANPTTAAGQTVEATTRMLFQSGVLDITVRNTTNDGAPTETLLSDTTMEVDVYEISLRKGPADNSGINYNLLTEYFTRGDQITKDLGGVAGSSPLSIDDRGVTPWDIPAALSRSKIKIHKKTKFFVNNGQTFTYQVRDAKRRVTSIEKLQTALTCNKTGWTKHVLFIGKLIPGFTLSAYNPVGPVPGVEAELTIGCTRKYLWKVEGIRDDRDYYDKN